MEFYQRKLYALLRSPESDDWGNDVLSQLDCLKNDLNQLEAWWNQCNGDTAMGRHAQDIASSSDRVNLHHTKHREPSSQVTVCHPISGQKQQVATLQRPGELLDISQIKNKTAKEVFWWFWRFYPELLANTQPDALLFPAHSVIPDCPLHSHQCTVSAITGAMFPEQWTQGDSQTPYLLLFSFSPVQEFIKSSRKFLDFWAGSYLLHYLSSRLCWYVAQELGPDAVILPSLWNQEIIDALMIKEYPDFAPYFTYLQDGRTPVHRFSEKISTSLSTAGFPNMITVLVPGKEAAQNLGNKLKGELTEEWVKISQQVQLYIREKVTAYLNKPTTKIDELLKETFGDLTTLSEEFLQPYRHELRLLQHESCWEWNKLWDEQIRCTWEPYWAAVPLGRPDLPLIKNKDNNIFDDYWVRVQQEISEALIDIPSSAEATVYDTLNVGTWWGSLQQRLRKCLIAVKNTRNWQIPNAPGDRSTISGQFSALHPRFNYTKFAEGAGTHNSSMRLFWLLISKALPGLFNGSERLNALETTKRMAWIYGGVAEELGVNVKEVIEKNQSNYVEGRREFQVFRGNQVIYERLLRFPNLTSIAAARFVHDHPELAHQYWDNLNRKIKGQLPKHHRFFRSLTRFRSFQIPKTDRQINPLNRWRQNYNGVMFSSKWLADDMGLQNADVHTLRSIINTVHQETGFGESSPADWWVIILADGDGMSSYVSGDKLKKYKFYIEKDAVDKSRDKFEHHLFNELLENTNKRMGPATHLGLNRALLDFSNRIVPYLTEKRFCGRVIYSGGDDVKVVLPLEDLPEYLLSLRAAWCGGKDPHQEFMNSRDLHGNETTGYWYPTDKVQGLPKRPLFTMGKNATMSAGVIIAHKSVPLPTVLENLWEAEGERAKKISGKDGICFRVIYGGGNQLEALMKGELLEGWWDWVKDFQDYKEKLSPLLYRLAEELPRRAAVTENYHLFSKAARVIMNNRDSSQKIDDTFQKIEQWLDKWEEWARLAAKNNSQAMGTQEEDLAKILRFTAFWIDKRVERWKWSKL